MTAVDLASFTVNFVVADVCDPPTVTPSTASPASVSYTIADASVAVSVPVFTISPVFCTISYSQSTAPNLSDSNNPTGVTKDANNRDFSVFYD